MSAVRGPNPSSYIGREVGREFTPPDDAVVIDGDVQPNVWPACATCGAAYVRRLGLTGTGPSWGWFRDCKHHAFIIRTTIEASS